MSDFLMFDFPHFYQRIAKELPNDCKICEVGVADGDSALFLAQELNRLGKKFKLYMVDNMDYGKYLQMKTIYQNIIKSELAGVITIESEPAMDGWDFNPWVGNLYVAEDFRNQGVGNYLLEMALVKLKELKYEKAYIWTDASNEDYYTRRLWTAVAGSELGERRILVFEKTL